MPQRVGIIETIISNTILSSFFFILESLLNCSTSLYSFPSFSRKSSRVFHLYISTFVIISKNIFIHKPLFFLLCYSRSKAYSNFLLPLSPLYCYQPTFSNILPNFTFILGYIKYKSSSGARLLFKYVRVQVKNFTEVRGASTGKELVK